VLAVRTATPNELGPGGGRGLPHRALPRRERWRASLGSACRWPTRWRASRRAFRQQRERLQAHPLFAACTDAELSTLLRWGDEATVPSGVELLREDRLGSCLVAVLSGRLAATRRGRDAGEVRAGGWVGDVSILGLGPQPATITTASRCVLFVLGPRPVASFATTLPGLRHGLFPGMSLDEALERVRQLRRDELPKWKDVRLPEFEEPAARPEWLRTYPTRVLYPSGLRPEPEHANPPLPPRQLSRRARIALAATVLTVSVAVCSAALVTIRLPYYSLQGQVGSAIAFIHVRGEPTYRPHDRILLPFIVRQHCTGLAIVRDWVHGTHVLTKTDVFGDSSPAVEDQTNIELMDGAKRSAVAAASAMIGDRAGPDHVRIETGDLGGPSGGLAFTLALIDILTPGDLAGGRSVAATGTIASTGSVGPVGGIRLKTLAARAAGADIFLVPAANYAEAAANAGSMHVVPVADLGAALRALKGV
jgi:Lon-like protease